MPAHLTVACPELLDVFLHCRVQSCPPSLDCCAPSHTHEHEPFDKSPFKVRVGCYSAMQIQLEMGRPLPPLWCPEPVRMQACDSLCSAMSTGRSESSSSTASHTCSPCRSSTPCHHITSSITSDDSWRARRDLDCSSVSGSSSVGEAAVPLGRCVWPTGCGLRRCAAPPHGASPASPRSAHALRGQKPTSRTNISSGIAVSQEAQGTTIDHPSLKLPD